MTISGRQSPAHSPLIPRSLLDNDGRGYLDGLRGKVSDRSGPFLHDNLHTAPYPRGSLGVQAIPLWPLGAFFEVSGGVYLSREAF